MAPRKRNSEEAGDGKATKKAKPTTSLTKLKFLDSAGTLKVKLGSTEFELQPKVLNTQSVGWSVSKRFPMPWKDVHMQAQVSLNCTAIGSKEWEAGTDDLPEPAETHIPKSEIECVVPDNMNRQKFADHAKEVDLELSLPSAQLNGQARPKQYDSNSCGWFFSGRLKPHVGSEVVACMVTLNALVVNSNKWPAGGDSEDEEAEEEEEAEEDEAEAEAGEGEDSEDHGEAPDAAQAADQATEKAKDTPVADDDDGENQGSTSDEEGSENEEGNSDDDANEDMGENEEAEEKADE